MMEEDFASSIMRLDPGGLQELSRHQRYQKILEEATRLPDRVRSSYPNVEVKIVSSYNKEELRYELICNYKYMTKEMSSTMYVTNEMLDDIRVVYRVLLTYNDKMLHVIDTAIVDYLRKAGDVQEGKTS